jgi:hypothetical protein
MCVAVTLLVPSRAVRWFEGQSWPSLSYTSDGLTCSSSVRARAGDAFQLYQIGKTCSCGWFTPASDDPAVNSSKELDRMLRKGWSPARAHRALAQSEAARSRRTAAPAGFADPIPDSVREIASHAGSCGIIAEWVGGSDAITFDPKLETRVEADAFGQSTKDFVFGRLFMVTAPNTRNL